MNGTQLGSGVPLQPQRESKTYRLQLPPFAGLVRRSSFDLVGRLRSRESPCLRERHRISYAWDDARIKDAKFSMGRASFQFQQT